MSLFLVCRLPSYARPAFIRLVRELDITGTYKLKKRDLQVSSCTSREHTSSRSGTFRLVAGHHGDIQSQEAGPSGWVQQICWAVTRDNGGFKFFFCKGRDGIFDKKLFRYLYISMSSNYRATPMNTWDNFFFFDKPPNKVSGSGSVGKKSGSRAGQIIGPWVVLV